MEQRLAVESQNLASSCLFESIKIIPESAKNLKKNVFCVKKTSNIKIQKEQQEQLVQNQQEQPVKEQQPIQNQQPVQEQQPVEHDILAQPSVIKQADHQYKQNQNDQSYNLDGNLIDKPPTNLTRSVKTKPITKPIVTKLQQLSKKKRRPACDTTQHREAITEFNFSSVQCRKCKKQFDKNIYYNEHVCNLNNLSLEQWLIRHNFEEIKEGSYNNTKLNYPQKYFCVHDGVNASVRTMINNSYLISWEIINLDKNKELYIHHFYGASNILLDEAIQFLRELVSFYAQKGNCIIKQGRNAKESSLVDINILHCMLKVLRQQEKDIIHNYFSQEDKPNPTLLTKRKKPPTPTSTLEPLFNKTIKLRGSDNSQFQHYYNTLPFGSNIFINSSLNGCRFGVSEGIVKNLKEEIKQLKVEILEIKSQRVNLNQKLVSKYNQQNSDDDDMSCFAFDCKLQSNDINDREYLMQSQKQTVKQCGLSKIDGGRRFSDVAKSVKDMGSESMVFKQKTSFETNKISKLGFVELDDCDDKTDKQYLARLGVSDFDYRKSLTNNRSRVPEGFVPQFSEQTGNFNLEGYYNIDNKLELTAEIKHKELDELYQFQENLPWFNQQQVEQTLRVKRIFSNAKQKTLGKKTAPNRKCDQKQPVKDYTLNKQSKEKLAKEKSVVVIENLRLLKVFRQKIKHELATTTQIFNALELKTSAKPFALVGETFTDGFSITNPILTLSEFVRFLKEKCGINIYSSKRTWQNLESKTQPKRFFIRLDDSFAVITPKLLKKLAKAMCKYRQHLHDELIKQVQSNKRTRSELTHEEIAKIRASVNSVFIQKFDDTQDMAGCLVLNENSKTEVTNFICDRLQYKVANNYKSSRSCLQFVGIKKRGKNLVRDVDIRHKFYCKDVHLCQTVSSNKEISIGHKPLFKASQFYLQKLADTMDTCLSRSERSTRLYSVEDEQKFLLQIDQAFRMQKFHTDAIQQLNSCDKILKQINCNVSREDLWKVSEDAIKFIVILWTSTHACILKAYDSKHSHFIGMFEQIKPTVLPIDLVKKYTFAGKPCHLYEIFSEDNYIKYQYLKLTDDTLVWVPPLCSNICNVSSTLNKIGVHSLNNLNYVGSLKSTQVKVYLKLKEELFETPEMANIARMKQAEAICKKYLTHKAKRLIYSKLDSDSCIKCVTWASGKLILFDVDQNYKFIKSFYSKREYLTFESKLINLSQHILLNNLHLFVQGLSSSQIQNLICEVIEEMMHKNLQQSIAKKLPFSEAQSKAHTKTDISLGRHQIQPTGLLKEFDNIQQQLAAVVCSKKIKRKLLDCSLCGKGGILSFNLEKHKRGQQCSDV